MLYVIRHGKTDWNLQYRLQGNTDIPLNDMGREMAREAADEYAGIHFDICFCSPLVRARETAELLLKGREIEIVYDDRIKEIGFGEYEGTDHVFDHPENPIYLFFKDPANYKAPEGAESFEALDARIGEFLEERVAPLLEAGKNVLIVGHGALNSAIIRHVRKLPLEEFWSTGIPNCKLIEV